MDTLPPQPTIIDEIPQETPNSNENSTNPKKILVGLVLLFLFISLPLALYLTQQRQEIRQRAQQVYPSPSPRPTPTASPSPTPTAQCGSTCINSTECGSDLACYIVAGQTNGVCRKNACLTDSDCICDSTGSTVPTPTPSAIPTVPRAGTTLPTVALIGAGILLLMVGLAF